MYFNKARPQQGYLEKRKKQVRLRWFVGGLVFILLFIALIFLSSYRKIIIDTINISGSGVLDEKEIQKKSSDFISGRYFKIFSKKNIFLYPKKSLEEFLKKEYPRIESLELTLTDNHTLLVDLTLREPFALWCDAVPTLEIVSKCYFLDKNGFVFAPAPQFSGDAYFKYYGILPFSDPVGSYFLSFSERFMELSAFVDKTKKLEISPLYMNAISQESFELYLFGGAKIILDGVEPILKSAERLSILLKTEGLLEKRNGILEVDYIDLRFGNKLFYKKKQ